MTKPWVIGKNLIFRDVQVADAEYVLSLRTDPTLNAHLSATANEVEQQRAFIRRYHESETDYYFIITDKAKTPVGTIRIYDIQDNSFCWGSWILGEGKPKSAGIESALMLYDFAFFALHYTQSHFDVRKANQRVIDFHVRFGAKIVREDDLNLYFTYTREDYITLRETHRHYLP